VCVCVCVCACICVSWEGGGIGDAHKMSRRYEFCGLLGMLPLRCAFLAVRSGGPPVLQFPVAFKTTGRFCCVCRESKQSQKVAKGQHEDGNHV
jgi:hypothetical protein